MTNKIDPFGIPVAPLPIPPQEATGEVFRAVERGDVAEVTRLLLPGAETALLDKLLEAAISSTSTSCALITLLVSRGASCTQSLCRVYLNIFDYAFYHANFELLFGLHQYYQQMPISGSAWENFFTACEAQDLAFITRYYPKLELQLAWQQIICSTLPWISALIIEKHLPFFSQRFKNYGLHPQLLTLNPETAKKFLDSGLWKDGPDSRGNSALHLIVSTKRDGECLPVLLQAGASLFLSNNSNKTPLQLALEYNHIEVIDQIQKSEAAKAVKRPSLHEAILANDLARMEKEYASFDLTSEDIFGNTARKLAIRCGNLSLVQFFAQHEILDNREDLLCAASYSSIEVVSFLIELQFPSKKVDPYTLLNMWISAKDAHNRHVAQWIVEQYACHYPQVLGRCLFSKSYGTQSLHILQEGMQALKKSADTRDIIEESFFKAVRKKQLQAASCLLDHVADLSHLDNNEVENFYCDLFENFDEEFVEKVLDKFGIAEGFFCFTGNPVIGLSKCHPALCTRLSPKLLERGWLLYKQNPSEVPFFFTLQVLAIYTGEFSRVQQFPCTADALRIAIEAGQPELVSYFCEKIPQLKEEDVNELLFLAIKLGDENVIQALRGAYERRGIKIPYIDMYAEVCTKAKASKELLARVVHLQRPDFSQRECGECVDLLVQSTESRSAPQVLFACIACSELKSRHKEVVDFVHRLLDMCLIPYGNLSPYKTANWLLEKIFCVDQTHTFDRILNLLETEICKPEDYETLLKMLHPPQEKDSPNSLSVPFQRLSLQVVEPLDSEGKTELFHAAKQGDIAEVKKLLTIGCNPNSQDVHGISILEAAVCSTKSTRYSIVRLLVGSGASCRQKFSTCLNIFDYAFYERDFGLLFILHQYYTSHIPIRDEALYNIFQQISSVEDLEFITRYYPKLELRSSTNYTICHSFISNDRLDLLIKYQQLVPQNFKKYIEDKQRFSPRLCDSLLAQALIGIGEKPHIVEFLRANGATFHRDPYLLTISPEITKQFLEEGMSPNEQDCNGRTALHYLAADEELSEELSKETLTFLLQSGANPFHLAYNGRIPFGDAQSIKNQDFLDIVYKSGLLKGLASPLEQAMRGSDLQKIAKELESFTTDIFGYSALGVAIFCHSLAALQLILSRIDSVWEGTLMFAAEHGSADVISFLVKQKFPAAEVSEDLICDMFEEAERANNHQVATWILEEYACHYPGGLFTRIVDYSKDKLQRGAFLLDRIDSISVFADVELFYKNLFEYAEKELIEKAVDKFGIDDTCLKNARMLEALYNKHPVLFEQHASRLFEQGLAQSQDYLHGLITIAVCSGQIHLLERLYSECNPSAALLIDHIWMAVEAGNQEMLTCLCAKPRPLNRERYECDAQKFFSAIKSGNERIIGALRYACAKQRITPDFGEIYRYIVQKVKGSHLSQEECKKLLVRTISIQTRHECEERATLHMQVAEWGAALRIFSSCPSPRILQELINFSRKLSTCCTIPCDHRSPSQTVDWIIEEVFSHIRFMNPQLFQEFDHTVSAILDLVREVTANEEYGALFVALQVAPTIELAKAAFRAAKRPKELQVVKISKARFLGSPVEEQKEWLAYALVYRDRAFIPHCHHILKHRDTYPELLLLALKAIEKIGVKRYNDELENTLEGLFKNILQTCQDEQVKIAALKAYCTSNDPSHNPKLLAFLLTQLTEARERRLIDYEVAVSSFLGTDYEWTSDQDSTQVVEALMIGLQSQHQKVRFQAAVALSAIPNERGLLAALEVVQGPTWDPMLAHFGKNRKDVISGFNAFRSRPKEVHDSRSCMIERIQLQLVRLYEFEEEHPDKAAIHASIESAFKATNQSSTRYVSLPIAYPPHTDLIRGISQWRGGSNFREAVRDLLRKGAGSSQLTGHETSVSDGTWNKIGHIFSSHNKELYFGHEKGSIYFSANEKTVVSDSALIVFPAHYYQKEYLVGQARLEREGTFNNVLYRGIPHRWIKAIYLPIRFKEDIELLMNATSLENLQREFKSELFKGDTPKELEAFRRLLRASEVDLTRESGKLVPFVEKIRYLPEVSAREVGEILLKDGVCFATEEQIREETAKQEVKKRLVEKHYKNPWLFCAQDRFLKEADDKTFNANIDRVLNMLPQAIFGEHKGVKIEIETDSFPNKRAPLRMAALLQSVGREASAHEILSKNPSFYGLE